MSADYILENWSLVERIARKQHTCEECRGAIPIGRSYMLGRGVAPKEGWQSFRFHKTCWQIAEAMRLYLTLSVGWTWDEMPAFGEMVETASEDAANMDDFPDYWPRGVYISTKALREHVEAVEGCPNAQT